MNHHQLKSGSSAPTSRRRGPLRKSCVGGEQKKTSGAHQAAIARCCLRPLPACVAGDEDSHGEHNMNGLSQFLCTESEATVRYFDEPKSSKFLSWAARAGAGKFYCGEIRSTGRSQTQTGKTWPVRLPLTSTSTAIRNTWRSSSRSGADHETSNWIMTRIIRRMASKV